MKEIGTQRVLLLPFYRVKRRWEGSSLQPGRVFTRTQLGWPPESQISDIQNFRT